jgi:hypothetical protein
MSQNETPIYVSEPTGRNLWQKYCVYPDRLELSSRLLLKTFVIPGTELIDVEVRPGGVIVDLWRGKSLASSLALKLDWADLFTHVAIRRKSGLVKYIRFTPDDPEKFVEMCQGIVENSP